MAWPAACAKVFRRKSSQKCLRKFSTLRRDSLNFAIVWVWVCSAASATRDSQVKITLINPPHAAIGSRIPDDHLPPLGPLSIGGPLIDAGHEVTLIDAEFGPLQIAEIIRQLLQQSPDVGRRWRPSGEHRRMRRRNQCCCRRVRPGGRYQPSLMPQNKIDARFAADAARKGW
ncbi:hypothetical protein J2W42_000361 [Rhizobium tibeticum]|nr:hypothetical protein [Rhizobium tibeticum]